MRAFLTAFLIAAALTGCAVVDVATDVAVTTVDVTTDVAGAAVDTATSPLRD